MEFDPSRLRRGEIIAGASAALLLVSMLVLPWYGLKRLLEPTAVQLGVKTSLTGWQSLQHLRWLMLLTILAAFALVYFQAARRAPALPASLSAVVTVLGLLSVLALIYRVLINLPGPDALLGRRVGGWVGLVSAVGIFYGGFMSTREEGIAPRDETREIPTVTLGPPEEG